MSAARSAENMEVDLHTQNFLSVCHQSDSASAMKADSPVCYTVTLKDAFSYATFNSIGQPQAWSILKMVECARSMCWWKDEAFGLEPFMEFNTISRLLFTAAADLHISEDVYDQNLPKGPVTAVSEVDYIGRTSFKGTVSFYLPGRDKPVVVSSTQFVFVDSASRKPSAPDSSWLEKYAPMMAKDAKPLRIPALEIPEGVEVVEDECRVWPSDIDFYMHFNWTNYCRVCVDSYTLHRVRKSKDEATRDRDGFFRTVKSFQSNFRGEASMGDVLRVKFWQNLEDADKFHFIFSKTGSVVNESTLVFHP